MVVIGFILVVWLLVLFVRQPYHAMLLSFFFKPVIDMFWESFYLGLGTFSPLYIAGVVIPFIALLQRKKITRGTLRGRYDRLIIFYLLIFAAITVMKMINAPKYLFNSFEGFARIAAVTCFFFIGKYYFQSEKSKKQLALAVVFSTAIPFFLTFLQIVGVMPMFKQREWTEGGRAAFYLTGRHDLLRISGVYEGVYELAFLGFFTAIIMLAFRLSKQKFPLWGYLMLFSGIYFLYFTYSRSAWALLVFSFVLFSLLRRKPVYLLLFIAVISIMYIMVPNIQYRFEDELGFIKGDVDFSQVGYSRGSIWTQVWHKFNQQETISKLIGNYGLGNPENQFLGLLIWFGYLGLFNFLFMIVILSFALWKYGLSIARENTFQSNVSLFFVTAIIGGYWVAGLGNFFLSMISTQWVLWAWTGAMLNEKVQTVEKRIQQRRAKPAFNMPNRS